MVATNIGITHLREILYGMILDYDNKTRIECQSSQRDYLDCVCINWIAKIEKKLSSVIDKYLKKNN